MLVFAAVVLISYLLGSIPAGYLVGRIGGIDIRKTGSGNIGATNVTRVLGKRYGYPVFAADFFKGFISVCLGLVIGRRFSPLADSDQLFQVIGAIFCVTGTTFPLWLSF